MKKLLSLALCALLCLSLCACAPPVPAEKLENLVAAHNRLVAAHDTLHDQLAALNELGLGLHIAAAWDDYTHLHQLQATQSALLAQHLNRLTLAEVDEMTATSLAWAARAEGWAPPLGQLTDDSTAIKAALAELDTLYDTLAALYDEVETRQLVLSDEFTVIFDAFLTDDDALWAEWDTLRADAAKTDTSGSAPPPGTEALLARTAAFREALAAHTQRLRDIITWLQESLAAG